MTTLPPECTPVVPDGDHRPSYLVSQDIWVQDGSFFGGEALVEGGIIQILSHFSNGQWRFSNGDLPSYVYSRI